MNLLQRMTEELSYTCMCLWCQNELRSLVPQIREGREAHEPKCPML